MKQLFVLIFIATNIFSVSSQTEATFLLKQKKHKRVRESLNEKENFVTKILSDNGLKYTDLNVLFVAYKYEKEFEIYAKKSSEKQYKKIAVYDICKLSGELGPKRREGDCQVPEGFYHISVFNPVSTFYLSLGINYPNHSDKIKSTHPKLGGDIYIHGKCLTIGCLPMTDDKIKEIYLYAVYAKSCGQSKIPVYIFPFRMTRKNLSIKKNDYLQWNDFWNNLKMGYDKFEKEKKELKFSVDKKGDYMF